MNDPKDRVHAGRTDSGYAECADLSDESPDRPRTSSEPLTKSRTRSPRATRRTQTDQSHDHKKSTNSSRAHSRDHNASRTSSSSRPSSTHHTCSRHHTNGRTGSSGQPLSRPASRRSLNSHRPYSSYSRHSSGRPTRDRSESFPHRSESPTTFHYKSCQLFQSLGTTLALHNTSSGIQSKSRLTSTSMPSFPHSAPLSNASSIPSVPPIPDAYDQPPPSEPSLRPVPTTVIDWKSTTTRRREYAHIDKVNRGLRGWWVKWAPKWCPKARRQGFYNEKKDSDAGSVRRYRLDLPEDDEAGTKEKVPALTNDKPLYLKARRMWSCFNLKEEKA